MAQDTELTQTASTVDQLRENFPFPTIRSLQDKALGVIAQSYDEATRFTVIEAPTGSGKCLALDTTVLMYDGTIRKVQDVVIGDLLMGDDSTPRTVLSTTRGCGPLFDVIPRKGTSYRVNDSHVLSLRYTNGTGSRGKHQCSIPALRKLGIRMQDAKVVDIPIQVYLGLSRTQKHYLKGFRTGVDFTPKALPIDPYFLGLWLGDGSSDRPEVTSADTEVIAFLNRFAESWGLGITPCFHNGCGTYNICGPKGGRVKESNPLLAEMRVLRVIDDKHIPLVYKASSREQRMQLLAGLMDSDGTHANGGLDFVFKSNRLACDVVFLCRSLGLAAYMTPCKKRCCNSPFPDHIGDYFRITVSGDKMDKLPVLLSRKRPSIRRQKKNVLNVGITVVPVGVGEYAGFTLDGNGRFLLGDFTVTHNSGMGLAPARWSASQPESDAGAHYLTSQNSLSRQLLQDFGKYGLVQIRGKNNYFCEKHGVNCSDGSMLNNGATCEGCPYRADKNRYVAGKLGVTNYTYYLTETRYSQELTPRKYLILDEAHNIEREILAMSDILITQRRCEDIGAGRLPLFQPEEDTRVRNWLNTNFLKDLGTQLAKLEQEIDKYKEAGADIPLTIQKRWSGLRQLRNNLDQYLNAPDSKEWLAWSDKDGQLLIRPLTAANFAQEYLFGGSPNILMMSATILDFATFRRNLGIPSNQMRTFAVPSSSHLRTGASCTGQWVAWGQKTLRPRCLDWHSGLRPC